MDREVRWTSMGGISHLQFHFEDETAHTSSGCRGKNRTPSRRFRFYPHKKTTSTVNSLVAQTDQRLASIAESRDFWTPREKFEAKQRDLLQAPKIDGHLTCQDEKEGRWMDVYNLTSDLRQCSETTKLDQSEPLGFTQAILKANS